MSNRIIYNVVVGSLLSAVFKKKEAYLTVCGASQPDIYK